MDNSINKDIKDVILVTGGSRSGKSIFAEKLLKDHPFVVYLATSKGSEDVDWQKRIDIHRKRRPDKWLTIEHPMDICSVIKNIDSNYAILLDSLGGLVCSYIHLNKQAWESIQKSFIEALQNSQSLFVLVGEETGWGVVPETNLGNIFRDRLGILTQKVQLQSSDSWLVIHGRAVNLTSISIPINI